MATMACRGVGIPEMGEFISGVETRVGGSLQDMVVADKSIDAGPDGRFVQVEGAQ